MNCEEARAVLDESADGALEEEAASSLSEHLAGCPSCAAEERALRALLHQAASLPRSLEPRRDLWEGIEARLEDRGSPGPFPISKVVRSPIWVLGLAAAAAILMMTGAGITWLAMGRAPREIAVALPAEDERPDIPAASPIAPVMSRTGLGEAGMALYETRRDLQAAVDSRGTALSPKTVEKIAENLLIIDRAIHDVQEALAKDPGNRELMRMLIANQQRQVAMLQFVARTATLRQERR